MQNKVVIALMAFLLSMAMVHSVDVSLQMSFPDSWYSTNYYVKVYYGAQPNSYTNSQTFALTPATHFTNVYFGYDQVGCVTNTLNDYARLTLTNLVSKQPLYYGYSIIDPTGKESAIFRNSVCPYTVN